MVNTFHENRVHSQTSAGGALRFRPASSARRLFAFIAKLRRWKVSGVRQFRAGHVVWLSSGEESRRLGNGIDAHGKKKSSRGESGQSSGQNKNPSRSRSFIFKSKSCHQTGNRPAQGGKKKNNGFPSALTTAIMVGAIWSAMMISSRAAEATATTGEFGQSGDPPLFLPTIPK